MLCEYASRGLTVDWPQVLEECSMRRTLSDRQTVVFDSSEWEQNRFERWMRVDEINVLLSPYLLHNSSACFLDLGGGAGRFSDLLLATYKSSSAVVADSSELLLSRNERNSRKTVLCVDALNVRTAFQAKAFDIVFVHRLLHHVVGDTYMESIRSIQEVLCQCAAILKPGGRLSIIENIWDGRFLDGLANRLLYYATSSRVVAPVTRRLGANTAGTGVCYLSDRLLTRLLRQAGLYVEAQQTLGDLRFPWYIRYPTVLKQAYSMHYWCRLQGA